MGLGDGLAEGLGPGPGEAPDSGDGLSVAGLLDVAGPGVGVAPVYAPPTIALRSLIPFAYSSVRATMTAG